MKTSLLASLVVFCFAQTMAGEPDWVAGIFYAGASKKAVAEVSPAEGPETTLLFNGAGAKDSPFAQRPMRADAKFSGLKFSLDPCGSLAMKVECWAEGPKGWCFQGSFGFAQDGWKDFETPLKEVESDQIKYLRFVIAPDAKAASLRLKIKDVSFSNRFSVEDADGIEAKMPFPKIWDDSDGKKSASVSAFRMPGQDGLGVFLRVDYSFPRAECAQVEIEYPELNMKAAGKELSFSCKGDGSANVLEIWASSPAGANVLLASQPLSSQEQVSVEGVAVPDDVAIVKNLKLVIVKKQQGSYSFSIDSLAIK